MNDEANKTDNVAPDLDAGWDLGDGEDEAASARPTVAPPFDLASYAKETMVPSSSNPRPLAMPVPSSGAEPMASLRPSMMPKAAPPVVPNRVISLPPPPPMPRRPVAPDLVGTRPALPAVTAAVGAGQAATKPQAALEAPDWDESFDAAFPSNDPSEAPRTAVPSDSPPSQRITPREMQALEAALTLSRQERTTGEPSAGPGPGTEEARPPRGDTLLSLANLRAPLLTPPRVAAVSAPAQSPPPAPIAADVPAISDPVVEMQERFALGDYSGALVMAESMLEENPTHAEAREYAESCRSVLQQMYTARIGPLDRVPVVDIARDQLRWLSIDHRTGFILSLVDGISSLEMILDVSGMPPLDALRMLFELVQQRIISIREE